MNECSIVPSILPCWYHCFVLPCRAFVLPCRATLLSTVGNAPGRGGGVTISTIRDIDGLFCCLSCNVATTTTSGKSFLGIKNTFFTDTFPLRNYLPPP